MNLQQALEILKQYRNWNKGVDIPKPSIIKVWRAIDVILNHFKNYNFDMDVRNDIK